MEKIVVLVGRAAVGKTTAEKMLEKEYGYQPLISHTTRPMREGETDGVDYHFVGRLEMDALEAAGQLLERVLYVVDGEEWIYALTKMEVEAKASNGASMVVTVNPHGIEQLKEHQEFLEKMIIMYLQIETNGEDRYFAREEDTHEIRVRWKHRLVQDDIDFDRFDSEVIPVLESKGVPVIRYMNLKNGKPILRREQLAEIHQLVEEAVL